MLVVDSLIRDMKVAMKSAVRAAWGLWVLEGVSCLSKDEPTAPETWASCLPYCPSLLVTQGPEATPPPDRPAGMISPPMHSRAMTLHTLNQDQTYTCHMFVPSGRKCT